ncbi:MAG: hypothetical protein EXR72_16870 [Myxococcales bacterium]|nr:hypothetical protein [Myxococcales bacterium]
MIHPAQAGGRRAIVIGILGGSLLLAGCRSKPAPPAPYDAGGVVLSAPAPVPTTSPLSQDALPTTASEIALGNLDIQIAAHEKDLVAQPRSVRVLTALVGALTTRGQYLGQIADYERAEELAERLVKEAPADSSSYLFRAGTRSTFHRFQEALADVAQAEKRGASGERVDGVRAAALTALGRTDEALRLRQVMADRRNNLVNLGSRAALLAELGRIDEAEKLFVEAQHHFPDVSPFPVAWLWLQQGLMWERQGKLSRARELYEAAQSRLAGYAPALAHLAGVKAAMGERDQAIALLRPLAGRSDDPEYAGQLAGLLREAGPANRAEADALRERARDRYEQLLARHPAAFADHAARFFLGAGADPPRARSLAEQNLKVRPTVEAHRLLLEACLAVGTPAASAACEVAERALSSCAAKGPPGDGGIVPAARCTPHLHILASRAFSACGRADRAAAELQAAGAAQ